MLLLALIGEPGDGQVEFFSSSIFIKWLLVCSTTSIDSNGQRSLICKMASGKATAVAAKIPPILRWP